MQSRPFGNGLFVTPTHLAHTEALAELQQIIFPTLARSKRSQNVVDIPKFMLPSPAW